ncbi:MAG: hypothetical protein HY706_07865 [Candidatus Hydrogenedentes bacterium]|nr:hypothetical protein [Candidatus Hydrogenedentota bacterium]
MGIVSVLTILAAVAAAEPLTLDLAEGWRFQPDPQESGEPQRWHEPGFDDASWALLRAGKRWEEQGFPEVNGVAWYRRHVDVPAAWAGKTIWFTTGGVNDSYVLYCNGQRVNSYGDRNEHSMYETPSIADLTSYLKPGASNLIAVRVLDWGASGGLWRLPCKLTVDREQLPAMPQCACAISYERKEVQVEVDCSGLGNEGGEQDVRIALSPVLASSHAVRAMAEQRLTMAKGQTVAAASFRLPRAQTPVEFEVLAELKDKDGTTIGKPFTVSVQPMVRPGWPAEYGALRIRNNFVTELLSARISRAAESAYSFPNPREGWVFLSVSRSGKGADAADASAWLDHETEPIVWRPNPDSGALEAMRFLKAGRHELKIRDAASCKISVRAVPELAFCYYPASFHITAQGRLDRAFMDLHVFSHVNTLVAPGSPPDPADFAQWIREGRHWLGNSSLPGLSSAAAPTVDEVYAAWSSVPGAAESGYAGIIVDEFLNSGEDHYRAWTEGIRRLVADPKFAGKKFYAFCGDLLHDPDAPSAAFARTLKEWNHRFAFERYLAEAPTEASAAQMLLRELQHPHQTWVQRVPGIEQHTVYCLGYMSSPPESLNVNPGVDYKVFMDMQFHLLATDPTFWGLYGVMEYSASYADEEIIRWSHRLFRHYCLEGNTERLSRDAYLLSHLQNPDFKDGLNGWRLEPAAEGTIAVKTMEGFSWLQGRYPRTSDGDQFLWMKSAAGIPNRVRQTLRNLQPGRLYSLKLICADLQRLDEKQHLPLSVEIEGSTVREDLSFHTEYPSNYAHELDPYNRNHPAWLNYYRVVFCPTAREAELTISDGAVAGHELAVNFIEVQPFFK